MKSKMPLRAKLFVIGIIAFAAVLWYKSPPDPKAEARHKARVEILRIAKETGMTYDEVLNFGIAIDQLKRRGLWD